MIARSTTNGFGGRRCDGFTLVEVAFALTILGVGLITLITLQTRTMTAYVEEENRFQAALIARYLMAMVESRGRAPQEGRTEGGIVEELNSLGYFEDSAQVDRLKESLTGWRFSRTVTPVGIGPVDDALRRVDLIIAWGPAANESYHLIYFARSPAPRPR